MLKPRVTDTRSLPFVADARFPDIAIQLLESRQTHPSASVIIARVAPGGQIVPHVHEIETETAYVLSGSGLLITQTETYAFEAGVIVTIPPGLRHEVRNTGEAPLEILAMHSPPTR